MLTGDAAADDAVDVLTRHLVDVDVHAVSTAGPAAGDTVFHDPQAGVHEAYGVATDRHTVLVLDRLVRVAHVIDVLDVDALGGRVEQIASAVASLPEPGPRVAASRQAPVLLVPDALSPALRDEVLAAYDAADPRPTGVETMADGRLTEALDGLRKQRRDHVVEDPDLLRRLTTHVGRRVMPEVLKAFAYRATRFEGFKIGAYDAGDDGFFAAHRDNLSSTTAHRQFALTINLDEDYEGGELRFPEYGPHLFRPAAGEALVFAGGHLHEVLPVTRGRRHVLLSFLYHQRATR